MLFRAQNILGYRYYADDVVRKFVERAAVNSVDVFRVFDAMNDARNLATAIAAVKDTGKHVQGTIFYTLSPVHNMAYWIDLAKQIEDLGSDSICIKDMAGLVNILSSLLVLLQVCYFLNLNRNVRVSISKILPALFGFSDFLQDFV